MPAQGDDTLGAPVLLIATEGGLGGLDPSTWLGGLPDPPSRSAAIEGGDAMANPRRPVSTAALLLKSSGKGKRTGEPNHEQRATLIGRRELCAKSQSKAKTK